MIDQRGSADRVRYEWLLHDPQLPDPQPPLEQPPAPQPLGLSQPPSLPQPPCTCPLAFGSS